MNCLLQMKCFSDIILKIFRDLIKQNESQIYHWGIKKDATLGGVGDDLDNRKSNDASSDTSIANRIAQNPKSVNRMKNMKDALRPYVAMQAEEAKIGSEPKAPYNKRFKKKLNRLFREEVGSKKAMYPEVDNWYERTRSRIVRAIRVRFKKSK